MRFRDLLMAAAAAGAVISSGPTYDYYIDDALGNDSNDGSEGSPWQSTNKINALSLGAGATVEVLVKAGTYDKATDYIKKTDSSGGGAIGAGSTLNITFESGVTMDGTAVSAVSPENGIELDGAAAHTTNVISLAPVGSGGLIIQNYNSTSGGASANGVSNRGLNTCNVYKVRVTGCIDGFSKHDTAVMNTYDCQADECTKSPVIHVGTGGSTSAERCRFVEKVGGGSSEMDLTDTASTFTSTWTNCEFVPDGTSSRFRAGGAVFDRCELGTTSAGLNLQWTSGQNTPDITDSFVNVYTDGAFSVTMLRAFGLATFRIRPGGTQSVSHCIFSGPGAGQTSIILGTTNLSGSQNFNVDSCIFETGTAAAFNNMTRTVADYLTAIGTNRVEYNCLSGSAAFDADLTASNTAAGGAIVANNTTADALIGAANTMVMTDYAFASGSPCIGAGKGGSDIGFGASECVTVGV